MAEWSEALESIYDQGQKSLLSGWFETVIGSAFLGWSRFLPAWPRWQRDVVWVVRTVAWESSGCCLPFCGIEAAAVVGGLDDALLEVLSPFDRSKLKLVWSGGSLVVGVDSVGGSPHFDVTDEGGD